MPPKVVGLRMISMIVSLVTFICGCFLRAGASLPSII